MGFRLYWLDTVTGAVGSPIQDVTACSWAISLNKVEELTFTIPKRSLAGHQRTTYEPLTGGVLLTHTGQDGTEYPLIAGPIIDWGTETGTNLELKCAGVRELFERRTIWDTLTYKTMSLGEIAWALAVHCMNRPGGGLPVVHGVQGGLGAQTRERTYDRWNVANNLIGKRWSELSAVINGPDIMLRPRWKSEAHTHIEWVFMHGVEEYPFIAQKFTPDFDTTALAAADIEVKVTSTGKDITHRIWCTGAGEGEGTAIAWAENLTQVWRDRAPFVEGIITDADQADTFVLKQKAEGALAARAKMIDQVTIEMGTDRLGAPLGSWFVGDTAAVTLAGWLSVPDGTRQMRIIKMTGTLAGSVTLDFQEASWQ